jgi:predicted molibdopterin-dependent oxidoreductase YjgC
MLQADRVVPTTCPYCGVGCQIDLHLQKRSGENGHKPDLIFRVEGRFDNEVNYGNLCVKGRFGYDFVHAPDRLLRPLVRDNRAEPFAETDWNSALDRAAAGFRRMRDEYGPDSVAVLTSAKCTNEENYLIQKFARAVIGTNSVDHCARL